MNRKKGETLCQVCAGIDRNPYLPDPVVLDGNDFAEACGSKSSKSRPYYSLQPSR